MKKGFSAYQVINRMAREVYGDSIHVEAAIFGDDYVVRDGAYQKLISGNTETVFDRLLSLKAEKAGI